MSISKDTVKAILEAAASIKYTYTMFRYVILYAACIFLHAAYYLVVLVAKSKV